MVIIIWSFFFSWLYLLQLVINKATGLMVALSLKIAVFDLSLILLIKSELTCRCFALVSNSKIYSERCFLWTMNGKKRYMSLLERKNEKKSIFTVTLRLQIYQLLSEAAVHRCSLKMMSEKFHRKTPVTVSPFEKVAGLSFNFFCIFAKWLCAWMYPYYGLL